MPTWEAGQYLQFKEERTRPCRELAGRINVARPARVVDLGCGPGNSTAVLRERWPESKLIGLDSSPDMIGAARKSSLQCEFRIGEITAWAAESDLNPEVIFSNAAMQWVADHRAIFPKLFGRVSAGGALAVQMPANFDAPAHAIMRDIARSREWSSRFPAGGVREWHVHELPFYYDVLAPHAAMIDLWTTEYFHAMPDAAAIVEWYKGTGLRPFLDALANDDLRARFTAQYLSQIERVYPRRADGRLLFPFRRLFFVAYAR